jgi:hypothetical protein
MVLRSMLITLVIWSQPPVWSAAVDCRPSSPPCLNDRESWSLLGIWRENAGRSRQDSGDCTRCRKSRTNRPWRELHGPSVPGIACTWHHEETHIADTSSKCLSRGANQGRVACQEKESLRRMRQLPQYSGQLKEGTVTKNMATATQQAMVCSSLVSLFHVERKQQDRTSWTAHGG